MTLALGRYDSPLGQLAVATVGDCVVGIDLRGDPAALEIQLIKQTGASASGSPSRVVLEGLDRYFAGDLTAIDALAVNPSGTPFQLRVWSALRDVRAGLTTSYSAIATRLGTPRARGGRGERGESDPDRHPVPSRHWRRRPARGLWRRPREKALVAGPRRRAVGDVAVVRGPVALPTSALLR